MNTILYFQPASKSIAPQKLEGVIEIAAKLRLHVQVVESRPGADLMNELVRFWHPLGAIAECGGEYHDIDPNVFDGVPTVFFSHNPETLLPKHFLVTHDSEEAARLAARELLMTGFKNFAFVPFAEKRSWSEIRRSVFSKTVSMNGFHCEVFESAATGTARQSELCRFLKGLSKPCALFAANDTTAAEVLTMAALSGVSVPDELAVAGVDNLEQLCERTTPSLSSVEPDFRRGGNLAMLMLMAVIRANGKFLGSRRRCFSPRRMVRRASTRVIANQDPLVSKALERIDREACSGLTAAAVAAIFPCTRRMADIRFSRAAGHSILTEIHRVRLEQAKNMLVNSDVPLKAISDFCGFTNANSLRKFFLRGTGMTMSAWRKRHRRDSFTSCDRATR